MHFTVELIIVGICLGGLYALIAIGYSLIYGVLKFINFAHGEFFAFGAYCAYVGGHYFRLPFPLTLVVGALGGALVAIAVERWIYRPVGHTSNLLLLVTSIGVSVILRNSLSILFGDQFKTLRSDVESIPIEIASLRITWNQLYSLIGVLFMWLFLWIIIWKTRLGLRIRAVANNRESAQASGIDVQRVVACAFLIGGAYAGMAGVFAGMIAELTPQMGILVGIKAFTAAVIGGIGNLTGSIIAGLTLGVAEALAVGFFGTQYRDTFVFALLLVALLIRPEGIIAKRKVNL
jgi:branched-chain amino acid transport system permease protein